MENFKDIEGYEGLYQVSDLGRVKRLKSKGSLSERILKTEFKAKYNLVTLYKNGVKTTQKVHRLVAIAFISNKDSKPQVNHIDGNTHNNVLSNLEWATNQENSIHAFKLNLRTGKVVRGEKNGNAKLNKDQVLEIRKKANCGQSLNSLGIEYKISSTHITRIVRGEKWAHLKTKL